MPGPDINRLSDHFIAYLFDQYKGTMHVRRIASWFGFILKGIENVATPSSLRQNRLRQVVFDYRGRHFKAKYNHKAGARGGIQIIEFLHQRGTPEVGVVTTITSLAEAERAYNSLQSDLDAFMLHWPIPPVLASAARSHL